MSRIDPTTAKPGRCRVLCCVQSSRSQRHTQMKALSIVARPGRLCSVAALVLLGFMGGPANAGQAHSELLVFKGICDGSAAIETADRQLLVGYDEDNRWYHFAGTGGHYLASTDYASQLGLGSQGEVDLEAVASGRKYIWWLGSHGRDGDGEVARNRRLLFRTNRVDPTVVVGRAIDVLARLPGATFDRKARNAKPKKGGINFEGLSTTATGGLMIGLRSPLSHGKKGLAAVLELPEPLAEPLQPVLHQLDLRDRGIRAMARINDAYLLVAGPVSGKAGFALYHWQPGERPLELKQLIDRRLNAEAIVRTQAGWLIVSDDGKIKRSDKSAKKGERSCDKIRRKNPAGERHVNVYFRAQLIKTAALQAAIAQAGD